MNEIFALLFKFSGIEIEKLKLLKKIQTFSLKNGIAQMKFFSCKFDILNSSSTKAQFFL